MSQETITIEGQECKLHMGLVEMTQVEKFYKGESVGMLFTAEKLGVDMTVTLLWAQLGRFQPEYQPVEARDKVLRFMDSFLEEKGSIEEITKKVLSVAARLNFKKAETLQTP